MRCVANYVVPVIVFSVVFNIPKFFEVEFVPIMEEQTFYINETGEYFTVSDD